MPNHALLHGRNVLNTPERKIRRVNVLTADFDEEGNWVPPVDASAHGIEGYKAPELAPKLVCRGQGMLDFKRKSDTSSFPQDFADYIRSYGEIYHWPAGGFHVVNRIADAKAILANKQFTANRATFFVEKMPDVDLDHIGDFFGVVARMMVMSDGKVHGMRRRSALFGINNELITYFIPSIRREANKLLDVLEETGELEFCTQCANILPASVLSYMFGIPDEDRAEFGRCTKIMTGFFGGSVDYTNEVAIECNGATVVIREYVRKLLLARKAKPENDFMSGMIEAQAKYNLMDDEIISQAAMMLVAGQVTSTDQIANNAFLMIDTPGVYQDLVEHPELMVSAQEEFMRWDPAVNFLFRVCKKRCTINGQRIDGGDTVFMSGHVINRDPDAFDNPTVIDIRRNNTKHFAFGHGAHYCIGARLGRIMMEELFTALVTRFPNVRFDPTRPPERDHYSLSFSGWKSMHLLKE